jgi:hypothetical protein
MPISKEDYAPNQWPTKMLGSRGESVEKICASFYQWHLTINRRALYHSETSGYRPDASAILHSGITLFECMPSH